MNENHEIVRIDDQTWRIEDGMVRCYLLAGAEKALLIDTGMTLKNAREIAEGLTDKPLRLLNTHADRDHIAGNGAFSQVYLHPAEEAHYRASGGSGEIVPVRGGDVLDLGGRALEILELGAVGAAAYLLKPLLYAWTDSYVVVLILVYGLFAGTMVLLNKNRLLDCLRTINRLK